MLGISTLNFIGIILTSLTCAALLLAGLSILARRPKAGATTSSGRLSSAVFLFDRDELVDATPDALSLLSRCAQDLSDWDKLLFLATPRFPDLKERLLSLDEEGEFSLDAEGVKNSKLEAKSWDGLTRLKIIENVPAPDFQYIDPLSLNALEDELETLRGLAEDSPQLIWKLNADHQITWANSAYLTLAEDIAGRTDTDVPIWPPHQIFSEDLKVPVGQPSTKRRVSVLAPNNVTDLWFDVSSTRRRSGTMHFANNVNALVKAEEAQRTFVQTLTKTFAHLPIGLAIFDRARRLVLFNPALLELSTLPVETLATRPSLHDFLDKIREARVLPEPKNYSTWRDKITSMETAAVDGTYCETWSLPNGQTYRVSGRPHPDGAVAFLFEDISADISSTRRFRSQIELGQNVIDALPSAIAVFSNLGTLTLSNAQFDQLWKIDHTLADLTIKDATRLWQSLAMPTPVWETLKVHVETVGNKPTWSESIQLKDGRVLQCSVETLSDGSTMCSFIPSQIETRVEDQDIALLTTRRG